MINLYTKHLSLRKIDLPLFIISFIALLLVPIIGVEVKGAQRWFDLYFFRLQPIELVKPFYFNYCKNFNT